MRGTRENRAPPCVKVPGSLRVPAYSSSTHRFPDERHQATPLSATSAELGLGLGLGLGWLSGLGLNFLLASVSFTLSLSLSLDSFCRPTAGKSSRPAGLFPLVYAYVVDCAPASPYAYSPRPHTGFPMSAHLSRLRLFKRHLRSLVWVWVWVWD
jgi:hypothetical protein